MITCFAVPTLLRAGKYTDNMNYIVLFFGLVLDEVTDLMTLSSITDNRK